MKKIGIIVISFFLALCLTIIPMPDWFQYLRPDWVLMVLLYWTMAIPERVGLFSGFFIGLILDVTVGSFFGQHAFAFVICVFIMNKLYQEIRVLPELQQSIALFFFFFVYKFVLLWLYGVTGQAPDNIFVFFLSAISSAILWPWLFILLREIRRKFMPVEI